MLYDVKISGDRIRIMTHGSESECAIYPLHRSAPHPQRRHQFPVKVRYTGDDLAIIISGWTVQSRRNALSLIRNDTVTDVRE